MNDGTRKRAERVCKAINSLLLEDLTGLDAAETMQLRATSDLVRRRIMGNCSPALAIAKQSEAKRNA